LLIFNSGFVAGAIYEIRTLARLPCGVVLPLSGGAKDEIVIDRGLEKNR
jgi:hypothetical protein